MIDQCRQTGQIFAEAVQEATQTLLAMRQRAWLAMLGIAISVAALVAMITLGHLAHREAMRLFAGMSTDLMLVQPLTETGQKPPPVAATLDRLVRTMPGLRDAIPLVIAGTEWQHGRTRGTVTLVAAPSRMAALARLPLASGRALSPLDGHAPHAVIGAGLPAGGVPGNLAALELMLGNTGFRVVGQLAPTLPHMLIGVDFNQAILVTPEAARRILADTQPSHWLIALAEGADDRQVLRQLRQQLEGQAADTRFRIVTPRQMIDTAASQMRIYEWLLLGIAAISLLVGGVGIMNVMLMNGLERRSEIGLRRALGARSRDIRNMFLLEAVLLTQAGAILGLVAGLAAGLAFAMLAGWAPAIPGMAIPAALLLATGTGLGFGAYPAIEAARWQPARLLRAA